MRVDLSRVQQASAMASDSESESHDDPPQWNRREESFDDYYDRAQRYLHRPEQELPRRSLSSLPSPFLKDGERRGPQNEPQERPQQAVAPPRRRKRPMMTTCPPSQRAVPRNKGALFVVALFFQESLRLQRLPFDVQTNIKSYRARHLLLRPLHATRRPLVESRLMTTRAGHVEFLTVPPVRNALLRNIETGDDLARLHGVVHRYFSCLFCFIKICGRTELHTFVKNFPDPRTELPSGFTQPVRHETKVAFTESTLR
jgi:hypothetical protein